MHKLEAITHPVRIRILHILGINQEPRSTQQILDKMPDVPKSSVYRHLKILLEGGIIEIADTRMVKAIEEKFYRMPAPPDVRPEDVKGFTKEDHINYFNKFLMMILAGFSQYVEDTPKVDFREDGATYTVGAYYATKDELRDFLRDFFERTIKPLRDDDPTGERLMYQFSLINYPLLYGTPSAKDEK